MSAPVPIEANLNTTQVSDTFIPAEKLFDKTNQSSLDNSFNMNLIPGSGVKTAVSELKRAETSNLAKDVVDQVL